MKRYKDQVIPAQPERTVTKFDALVCDICGKKTKDPDNWAYKGMYSRDAVEIEYISSDGPIGYGTGDKISFDICPECFTSKLVPWMESQGAKPTKTDIDY